MGIRRRRWIRWTLAVLMLAPGLVVPAGAAGASGSVELTGRGWGHGRGLGQYGALGYAIDHGWSWDEILDHFYGGTEAGSLSAGQTIGVRLLSEDGLPATVQRDAGAPDIYVDGILVRSGGTTTAVRVELSGEEVTISDAPDCGGPFTEWSVMAGTEVTLRSPVEPGDDRTEMVQICSFDEAGQLSRRTWYRGSIRTVLTPEGSRTVNDVMMEQYLRGVVPRESPASWGTLDEGRGMHALRAQAVAARSYASAESRYEYAQTCDTTSCQVYGGHATVTYSGTPPQPGVVESREHPITDTAIAETADVVRIRPSKSGDPVRTEFSSSTGGYTTGSSFPNVIDEGDDVALNPNHNWEDVLSVATVEARYQKTGLQAVTVTARNGLGADGGRVLEVVLQFSDGKETVTGAEFRSAFGLKSDWFVPGPVCLGDPRTDPFPDIACNIHHPNIVEVADRGIAQGFPDGLFRPENDVTRGQMATFLVGAFEIASDDGPSRFSDIDDSVHRDSIQALAASGIASGFPDGTFRPLDRITREQMATFLAASLHLEPPEDPSVTFSDIEGRTHEQSVLAIADAGVTVGYPDGTFRPLDPVTRGQMATFLIRSLSVVESG